MADNLSVNITADATQMRAQIALAQANLRAYAAEVRKAAADIRQSGNAATAEQVQALEKASASYNAARAAVQQHAAALTTHKTAVNAASVAVKDATTATHNHGAATEAMVLVHEAMSGRFSRMGGSLMILTQRLGGASLAMMAMGGAAGVAAMGLMHLVEWMDKVSAAKLAAEAGGVGSGIAVKDLDAQVDKLSKVTTEAEQAGAAVHTMASLPGMNLPVMDQLSTDLHALSLRMGEDIPSAAKKVGEAWNLNAVAGAELLNKTRATTAAVQEFVKAAQEGDALKARSVLLMEVARSTAEVAAQTKLGAKADTEANTARARVNAAMANAPGAKTPASALKLIDAAETRDAGMQANRLAAALANVSTVVKGAEVTSWSQRVDADLQKAVFATEQSAHAQGATWQKIHEAMADTSVKFWQDQVGQTKEGTKNREEAERHLMTALEAQDMAHIKADATGAKQALHEQLTALTEQQAAHHDDFQVVMQIEDQKIALLRAAGKEYTAELNRELTARENLIREHANKVAGIDLETIKQKIQDGRAARDTERNELSADVAEHMMTKQAEITQLRSLADLEFAVDNLRLQNFIDVQDKETEAYRAAITEQKAIKRDYVRTLSALDAQMAAANAADQRRNLQNYQQMFQGVGSAGKSAVEGLITGSMTWQQAEANVAKQVLGSAINLSTDLLSKWVATEIAKTMYSKTALADRVAAEQTAGSSGFGAILAKFLGLESAKTLATDAGVAARITAEEAASTGAQAPAAAAAVAEVVRQAAVAAAGAFAATAAIPIIGPELAPGAGMAAMAAVQAYAPMASFAVGAWELPHDMIAQVHAGEMIIPAGPAAAIRAGGNGSGTVATGGGGGDVHLHVHAVDAGSVTALFRSQGADLARIVSQQLSNNPSLRPRY